MWLICNIFILQLIYYVTFPFVENGIVMNYFVVWRSPVTVMGHVHPTGRAYESMVAFIRNNRDAFSHDFLVTVDAFEITTDFERRAHDMPLRAFSQLVVLASEIHSGSAVDLRSKIVALYNTDPHFVSLIDWSKCLSAIS